MKNIVDTKGVVNMKNISTSQYKSKLKNLLQAAGVYVRTKIVYINYIANMTNIVDMKDIVDGSVTNISKTFTSRMGIYSW